MPQRRRNFADRINYREQAPPRAQAPTRNGIYPFIDYSTDIDGMIKAFEVNVAPVTDNTIVIPGHGKSVSNKAELLAYRDMLVTIRHKVAKLKQQGRSLDETIDAKPTAAFDAKWGQFRHHPAFFTRVIYQGV
jgi:hypothetical protein